jgi:WD40 repeat protein
VTITPLEPDSPTAPSTAPPLRTSRHEAPPFLPLARATIGPDNFSGLEIIAMLEFAPDELTAAAVDFSRDGTTLAVSTNGGELRFWDYTNGALLQTHFSGEGASGTSAALEFSPRFGRYLAAATKAQRPEDGEVMAAVLLWDSYDPEAMRFFFGSSPWGVLGIAFSPDEDLLAVGTREGMGGGGAVKIWDLEGGSLLRELGCDDRVSDVAFAPEGLTLLALCGDRLLGIDPGTGAISTDLALGDLATGLAFSSDGAHLAVRTQGAVHLHDGDRLERIATLPDTALSAAHAFSPDGRVLAAVVDSTLVMWDVRAGVELGRFQDQAALLALEFATDGRALAIVNTAGQVRLLGVRQPTDLPADAPVISAPDATNLIQVAQLAIPKLDETAFTPDGARLLLSTWEGLLLLDLPTLQPSAVLPSEREFSAATALSSNGRWLAWSPLEGTVEVVDLGSADLSSQRIALAEGCCRDLAISPDGRTLVSLASGMGEVWALPEGERVYSLDGVQGVALSPDGGTIAFESGMSLKVDLWDVGSRSLRGELSGFTTAAPVYGTQFSPDWRSMAWGSRAHMQISDVASGTIGPDFIASWGEFSPSGDLMAVVEDGWYGEDFLGQVMLIDVASSEQVGTLQHGDMVRAVAFSPAGDILVSASGKLLTVWDVARRSPLKSMTAAADVRSLIFSPDGSLLLSVGAGSVLEFWAISESETSSQALTPQNAAYVERSTSLTVAQPTDLAFSPLGTTLGVATESGAITLWNWPSGYIVHHLEGHDSWVYHLAFSANGQGLVSASMDGTLRFWDTAAGNAGFIISPEAGEITSVAYAPDGSTLAYGSQDGSVRLIQLNTMQERLTLSEHDSWIWDVAYAPDSLTLASASADDTVILWDAATGQIRHTLQAHSSSVWDVDFSPDGGWLASASWDGTAMIWDVGTGVALRTLEGHTDWVYRAAFSPGGQLVATASEDGTVRLWNATSGELLNTLEGHGAPVRTLAFAPDGETLASASEDGNVIFWRVER